MIMNIYILNVMDYEEEIEVVTMYFSTQEKAVEFINNNFEYDKPRKITNDNFEGKKFNYFISEKSLDQMKI